jgi:hypothetical protein
VRFPTIEMTYVLTSPITTFREYKLAARNDNHTIRRRVSGGVGIGVREGERSLKRIDQRLLSLGDYASQPYAPAAIYVVSKSEEADDDETRSAPPWAWEETLSFHALVAATDVERGKGAVVGGAQAACARDALGRSGLWRQGEQAAWFRARPALPHEVGKAKPIGAPPPAAPPIPPPMATAPSRPAAPSPFPAPAPLPAPPPAAPAAGSRLPPEALPTPAGTVPLLLVGAGEANLGAAVAPDTGTAAPTLYVGADAAAWAAIFEALLPSRGPAGPACAAALGDVRAAGAAYDFSQGPLLLLLGPVTDNYAMEPQAFLDVYTDRTARWTVAHRHEDRRYGRAPDQVVVWRLHRAVGALPGPVHVREPEPAPAGR